MARTVGISIKHTLQSVLKKNSYKSIGHYYRTYKVELEQYRQRVVTASFMELRHYGVCQHAPTRLFEATGGTLGEALLKLEAEMNRRIQKGDLVV